MSRHDTTPDGVPRRPRLRLGERAGGMFFRATTRAVGLKPSLVPAHMRRQLQVIGVRDDTLERVLGGLRSLADWPYAWEAEGDRRVADGEHQNASLAYYMAQRVLLTPSPLKARLYALMREQYARIPQPQLEHLRVETASGTVAGLLQLPDRPRPAGGHPLVLLLPGITATKEELHPFAMPLLARGYAVARIDNPGYGETTGVLRDDSMRNAACVLDSLATDGRLDADRMHLFSMSLGGFCAMHSAIDSRAASIAIIASPFEPHRFLPQLPQSNITALLHMTGYDTFDELHALIERLSMAERAAELTIPMRIFHGGRDRTIPVGEAGRIAAAVSGPTAVTIWDRDHHTCLEHFDDMVAMVLEWLHDPYPSVRAWEREQAARSRAEKAESASSSATAASHLPGDVAGELAG